jgi:hypothetical protein
MRHRTSDAHDRQQRLRRHDGLGRTVTHDHLGDPTIADAVLDRVVRNAHRITLKGPTMRPSIQEKTSKT